MTGFVDRLRAPAAFLVGTWAKIPAMETVELLGHVGFDFVVIDMEHAPIGIETAYRAIVQAQAMGMAALVRVPDRNGSMVQRVLDAGADGILVPRVDRGSVVRAMAALSFPPTGDRGMGLTARAGRWGLDAPATYLARGEGVLRCAQVEDRDTLEGIDAVLDAPGLNALFIGFGDLSLSSGLPADHPELAALEASALRAAAGRGIPCGTAVQTAAQVARCRNAGYRFAMVSADTSLFAHAATAMMGDVAEALGRR